jgi:hypothetical protein
MPKVNQFMANIFYRNQPTDLILKMTYSELRYWSSVHDLISQAEVDAVPVLPKK